MLIICLLFMICGCKKEEKETIVDKIVQKDNLVFEYADKIKLYDLVNTEEKLTSDNNYIDTYKLGNNEVNIDYLNSKNKKKKYKVTYEIVDTTKPIILLSSSITAYKGNNVNLVNKAICADNYDKKPNCYIEGDYDINKVGKYNLKYIAIDSNNNKKKRKVIIIQVQVEINI